MFAKSVILASSVASAWPLASSPSKVLEPIGNKSGVPEYLVFVPAEGTTADQYVPQMRAIQAKASFPLWVGIGSIEAAQKDLIMEGAKGYYAGLGSGAFTALEWARAHPSQVKGVIAEAGYIDEQIQDPAANFGTRVLTLGADMDTGAARSTRLAIALDAVKNSSVGWSKSKYSHPVVELLGANTVNFISGAVPASFQKTNMRAMMAPEEGWRQCAEVITAFMTNDAASHKIIDKYVDPTAEDLSPYIEMLHLEGNPWTAHFDKTVPLTNSAAKIVAGKELLQKYPFEFHSTYNKFRAVEGDFTHSKASVAKVGNKWDFESYGHAFYPISPWAKFDNTNEYYSARDVGAKMLSRENVYAQLGVPFHGKEASCQEINQATYNTIMDTWDNWVGKHLFQRYGQPIHFAKDTKALGGPDWVNLGSSYKRTSAGLEVSARALLSPMDFPLKEYAGQLYCKLMSPARMMEWMMIDGIAGSLSYVPNTKASREAVVIDPTPDRQLILIL